jgi:hypothetical protein
MTAYTIYIDDATIENGCLCVYPGAFLFLSADLDPPKAY